MLRADRITCAGCDKRIDGGSIFEFSSNLFRLFISTRTLKVVTTSDSVCRKCRWKFDNWTKKTKSNFNDFMGNQSVEKVLVNILCELECFI